LFLDHPIEDEVILVSHTVKEVFEKLAKVADVWLFFKL
jgi:hypothetical protein